MCFLIIYLNFYCVYLKLIIWFLLLLLESRKSDENINLNEYSETDFCGSIDTHRLNTELFKLQVQKLKTYKLYFFL